MLIARTNIETILTNIGLVSRFVGVAGWVALHSIALHRIALHGMGKTFGCDSCVECNELEDPERADEPI